MKKLLHNIFLIGPMGAGKTSVGRYLASHLDKTFYDSDQEIEKRMGVSLSWIYDIEGLDGYRKREFTMIDELSQLDDIVLSTGGDCVEEPDIRDLLKARGQIIYMEVSLQTQLRRLSRDKRRPLLQGENPKDVLKALWEKREPLYENLADFTISTDHRSIKDVCEEILSWLLTRSL